MLESALAGTLWPLPVEFRETADGPAALLVHGPLAATRPLSIPSGSLVLHASDEGQEWDPSPHRGSAVRTWTQYASPIRSRATDRRILVGPPPGTRETLAGMEMLKPSARAIRCGFYGQTQNASRKALASLMAARPDCRTAVSDGFARGLDQEKYLALLAETAIAPCPVGNLSPDTMRLYEALEAGCLPIVERCFPGWPTEIDFWEWTAGTAGPPPFPRVDDWSELAGILARYAADPAALDRDATRALAWWIGYKRSIALDLVDDCRALGMDAPLAPITVAIPTSPVPRHPSTAMIEDTIERIRAYPELARAEILIMIDGVRPEQEHRRADYEEYTRRLVNLCNWDPRFFGVLPIVFREFSHQARMLMDTLPLVRTPLLFYCEHDMWPEGEIDFAGIFRALAEPTVNVVRLYRGRCGGECGEDAMHASHIAMLLETEPRPVAGVPMLPTTQWSQNPHVARTDFYRALMPEYFRPESRTMIEDALHGHAANAGPDGWSRWGIWMYAPERPVGPIRRCNFVNGRGDDPSYGGHV